MPAGGCARFRSSSNGARHSLEATHLVLAAGPMQREMARMIGVDLPIYAERHHKVSFADTLGGVPRSAPMMIWLDAQHLPWSEEERAALDEDEEARWLLQKFPAGVHGRPDGAHATLVLFNHHGERGRAGVPAAGAAAALCRDRAARHVDHGAGAAGLCGQAVAALRRRRLLHATRENRPLIGPLRSRAPTCRAASRASA